MTDDPPTAPLGGAPREAEPQPTAAPGEEREINALFARLDAAHLNIRSHPEAWHAVADLADATNAIRAQLAAATARVHELEADAERLDWLEEDTKYNVPVELWTTLDGRRAYGTRHDGEIYGSTLREVIDTARAALRQEEPRE